MMKRLLCILLTCVLLIGTLPISIAASETEEPTTITFGLFSDLHYKEGMYVSSVADLNAIMKRSNDANADFVMQVGDFSNDWKGSPEIVNAYLENSYGLPAYGVYGNHELETAGNSMQVVTPLLTNDKNVVWGTADGKIGDGSVAYYYYDIKGFRIVCTDTNYSYNPTKQQWEHNETNSWGAPDGNEREHSFGPEQLAWIEEVLTDAANKSLRCIFFSHASVSSTWSPCPDAAKVQEIFAKVNAIQNGTVMMAINGHLHTNHVEMKEGVLYFDMNTVRNGAWKGDQAEQHYTNETFTKVSYDANGTQTGSSKVNLSTLSQAKNTWFFEDPLSAVVTVSLDGRIEIDGSSTTWIGGIAPSFASGTETGVTPRVSSCEYHLGDKDGVIAIGTAADLKKIGKDACYPLNGSYKLTANIDLGGAEWVPIGEIKDGEVNGANTPGLFTGVFDGNGYTVSNFKITTYANGWKSHCGFFGGVSGTVKNLTIANATYESNTSNIVHLGCVVGTLYGGTVSGCQTEENVGITVTNASFWGGAPSYPTYDIPAFGGIVGQVEGGTVEYCVNRSTVASKLKDNRIKLGNGGIVGRLMGGTVTYCINNGDVVDTNGTNWGRFGGVVGYMAKANSIITNCINNGKVATANRVYSMTNVGVYGTTLSTAVAGGIVGQAAISAELTISNNFNLGEVFAFNATDRDSSEAELFELKAQIVGWDSLDPNTVSGNYGLNADGCIKFAQEKVTTALRPNLRSENAIILTTADEIKANATYRAIVAEVAERTTGISTDLYGYQTKAAEGGKFDLRLVATLSGDYAKLENVGFKVEATYTLNGEQKKATEAKVTKLYNSVTATSKGVETTIEHTAASLGGDYIFVLACKGIPEDAENLTFTVTTFHTVKGATDSVYATTKTFVVAQIPADTLA